jgi:hypothetical protein
VPGAERSRGRLPLAPAAYGVAALLVLGAVLRLNAFRAQARAEPVAVPAPVESVEVPREIEERLRAKIALLDAELRREPKNPLLLTRAAELCLTMALYHQEDQGAHRRWLDRASARVRALMAESPELGAELDLGVREPQRLVWSQGSSYVTRFPAFRQDRAVRIIGDGEPASTIGSSATMRVMRFGPSEAGAMAVGAMPARADTEPGAGTNVPGPANGPVPAINGPGGGMNGPPVGINGPPFSSRAMPFPGALSGIPGAMGSGLPPPPAEPPDAIRGLSLHPREIERTIATLAKALQSDPDNLLLYDQLARTLEVRGEQVRQQPSREPLQERKGGWPYLRRAAQCYSDAGDRAPLVSYRAAYYCEAADIYFRTRDWDRQYRMLQKAAEAVPTCPVVWRELQGAALRSGRLRETESAARSFRDWSLPTVRIRRDI